ncbi:MAG TPA: DNA repair protein RadA, partial [Desulfomicrobiaceae bacterium]|nr:DNA repair protein RadA [Desulfomicrobiaceae bacterium]
VQTMASAQVDGIPGSVSQVRAVATQIIEKAKQCGTAVVLVGHVTKEGQIAGPKLLEHMVDTVLYLEGDKQHLFRMLRVVKNRFGPSNELLLFEMQSKGMEVVHDPSTFFLQARDPGLSGTALVMGMEAQRPFAVEVQALATKTFLAFPRRTALGFDSNRLNLLLAVMEKRLRINTGQTDIYAKVGGGLRLQDPGMDLGLVAAVLSSFYDRALPEGAVFWGEVDLNGQIRPVFGQDMRLRQAKRIGYDPIFCPTGNNGKGSRGWSNLVELQRYLFGK